MHVIRFSLKKKILMLVPAIVFAGILGTYAMMTGPPLTGKVILVDVGHGGVDSGADRPGIQEKDINLAVALELKRVLNQYGAKVILSREGDTDLSGECDNEKVRGRYRRDLAARIEMVEESDADLFVSIHANASPLARRHGAESFYYRQSPESKTLAQAIQAELVKASLGQEEANAGNYFVLRRNKVAAALIEVGYITNPQERSLLQEAGHQHKLAQAIAQGICQYYQLSPGQE